MLWSVHFPITATLSTLILTTYRVYSTRICILAQRGRFLETILKDGARSGVPRLRREPHRGRSGPRPPGIGLARAVAAAPVPLPGAGFVGPHPKTATVERRERSRSPRDRVVARRRRDRRLKSAPVGAPSTPHRGDGIAAVATAAGAKAPWARRRTRKRRHLRRDAQTRAQQRAAGTNNTALFDIVNTTTANGSLRAPRRRTRRARSTLVSRASAARPGNCYVC